MSQLPATPAAEPLSFGSKCKKAFSKPSWQIALLLGLVTFGMGATLSCLRWPEPFIHDEFSYLLAADTFCEGRLTNPTHPFWQHFESFHIIHEPSYSSKYPPGQGLFLALGQWITGHAIAGVWLLSALAAMACYWMLLGWVPPRWAAAGGLLFVCHPGYQIEWGQTYWGGTLAFLGGTLVCGAAAHLVKRLDITSALAMGTGTSLLAFSRPYEGLVFCLLCGGLVLAGWSRLGWPQWQPLLLRTVVPMASVLLVGGIAFATYNQSVTGSYATLPYQVHEEAYTIAPLFMWQDPGENQGYRHRILAKHHYGWMMAAHRLHDSLPTLLQLKASITERVVNFFLPLPFAVGFLFMVPSFWKSQGNSHRNSHQKFWRLGVFAVVLFSWLASMLTAVFVYPHYMAPMAPLLLLLTIWGLRYAAVACRHTLPSCNVRWLIVAFLVFQATCFGYQALAHVTTSTDYWPWHRAEILSQLETTPEKHLIFVRYASSHSSHFEWVYNRADIDASQVIWAREMTPTKDQALVDYFADRKVWLLKADLPNPKLQPWHSRRLPSSKQQGIE